MVGLKYLRKLGENPVLKIGVQLNGERVFGHAWLEIDGQVVNDDASVTQRFSVMKEISVLPRFR